jgi:hypothetical protein
MLQEFISTNENSNEENKKNGKTKTLIKNPAAI